MNTRDIERSMLKDKEIRIKFKGVYPIDMIPINIPPMSLIVVNLDPSYETGSHWVVVHYLDDKNSEHFDSLGRKPERRIHNLLMYNNMTYKYNNQRIQNFFSETCGLYCIYYSYYSSRGRMMEDILKDFNSNLEYNDEIVKKFYLTQFIM